MHKQKIPRENLLRRLLGFDPNELCVQTYHSVFVDQGDEWILLEDSDVDDPWDAIQFTFGCTLYTRCVGIRGMIDSDDILCFQNERDFLESPEYADLRAEVIKEFWDEFTELHLEFAKNVAQVQMGMPIADRHVTNPFHRSRWVDTLNACALRESVKVAAKEGRYSWISPPTSIDNGEQS